MIIVHSINRQITQNIEALTRKTIDVALTGKQKKISGYINNKFRTLLGAAIYRNQTKSLGKSQYMNLKTASTVHSGRLESIGYCNCICNRKLRQRHSDQWRFQPASMPAPAKRKVFRHLRNLREEKAKKQDMLCMCALSLLMEPFQVICARLTFVSRVVHRRQLNNVYRPKHCQLSDTVLMTFTTSRLA